MGASGVSSRPSARGARPRDRRECEDDERKLETYRPGERHEGKVRLGDVLLRSEVMVYEPLWTRVPSNRAILPVLWSLFPSHPYLLETSFELTDSLRAKGYVTKPIVGRCGGDISLFDRSETLIERTSGRFADRDRIYQELFPLARAHDLYVQPSTFSVMGAYAASAARVDESLVITDESDNVPLRVVDDGWFRGGRGRP